MTNAIILAAGKSEQFAPFTYEKPKGLISGQGRNFNRTSDRTASRGRS